MNNIIFDLYKGISIDQLLVYSIYILNQENKEATFENVVAKCFELFPERFSLFGYPNWPDSSRVNKSWLRCRTDFKYVFGSVKEGFHLTTKGNEIVKLVESKLNRPSIKNSFLNSKIQKSRTRENQFVNELKKNETYIRYKTTKENTEISRFELCDMLYCTLESPASSLRENLKKLKEYCIKIKNQELVEFLDYVEKKCHTLLFISENELKYSGGMNKKKNE